MDLSGLDIVVEGSQNGPATSKNKVDIVFVIDNSGSMSDVIEGVKNHINTFVTSLEKNANNKVDYRIGFVMHGSEKILVKEFTTSAIDFQQSMQNTKNHDTGWNEFGLPALDIAADFPWEDKRHKFIIIFTDESTHSGHDTSFQLSKFDQLLSKLETLRTKIYYLGVDAEDYQRFKEVPGTYYEPNDTFEHVDFSELLNKIGKSVSQASGAGLQGGQNSVAKDLYDVKSKVQVINL